MIFRSLFLSLTAAFLLQSTENVCAQDTIQQTLIVAGKGFGSFIIGETTQAELVQQLGKKYKLIEHANYSTEYAYKKLGVSFYFYQDQLEAGVFAIKFNRGFNGVTEQGIRIQNTTAEDVIKIFDEPQWTSCMDCDYWSLNYEGISFEVARDKSLPHFPLNKEAHLKRPLISITVSND